MKKTRLLFSLTSLAACFWSAPLQAAAITFGPATNISGDTDVVTTGTLERAREVAGAGGTVNTVTFGAGLDANSSIVLTGPGGSGLSGAGFGGSLSVDYNSVIDSFTYADSSASNASNVELTLSNLSVGQKYLLQIFLHDARIYSPGRSATVSSPGGNSVALDYNVTDTVGAAGQFTIGTFTADAVTQVVNISAGIDGTNPVSTENGGFGQSAQLNAFQLRLIPEPSSLSLAAIAVAAAAWRHRKKCRRRPATA